MMGGKVESPTMSMLSPVTLKTTLEGPYLLVNTIEMMIINMIIIETTVTDDATIAVV